MFGNLFTSSGPEDSILGERWLMLSDVSVAVALWKDRTGGFLDRVPGDEWHPSRGAEKILFSHIKRGKWCGSWPWSAVGWGSDPVQILWALDRHSQHETLWPLKRSAHKRRYKRISYFWMSLLIRSVNMCGWFVK